MSKGQKPAPSFWGLVGRVAGALFGVALTSAALLIVTGEIAVENGAGEPITNIFVRILLGLVVGAVGLGTVCGAIEGFPEGPHSSSEYAGNESGFDGDGDIDID
ncbi:hypothetical protein P3102_19605 [Amycolatopsis sp. QT-25]|uniref:hypothetical protein n=1 Tax=Amycolatopsis sp. QT-25 TaxID=3034022 RepID=UPI0023EE2753|nr:hypothetical protein [Amycolatopsis sp. QT-25]WET76339.1 hypothetical protein P3102_19605 [Amycolatopsis sp. QT-25]